MDQHYNSLGLFQYHLGNMTVSKIKNVIYFIFYVQIGKNCLNYAWWVPGSNYNNLLREELSESNLEEYCKRKGEDNTCPL